MAATAGHLRSTPMLQVMDKPKRKVIDHKSYMAIALYFIEAKPLTKVGEEAWRYNPGLNDGIVASILKEKVPNICKHWVAFTRRKEGMPLYEQDGKRSKQSHKALGPRMQALDQRVFDLEQKVELLKNHVQHSVRLEVRFNELAARLGENV
jgi:hypothetical protein